MVHFLLRATAIAAVLLTLGGAKVSAGIDEGVAALKRGDYSRLIRADEAGTLGQLKVLRKEVFDPRTAEHR